MQSKLLLSTIQKSSRAWSKQLPLQRSSSWLASRAIVSQNADSRFAIWALASTTIGIIGLCSDRSDSVVYCDSSNDKVFTLEEISKHNSVENRVWVTYGDDVFDVTDFLPSHPGGPEKLLLAAGKAVEPYWNVYRGHYSSAMAMNLLSQYRIGSLHPDDVVAKEKEPVADYDPYENEPNVSPKLRVHQLSPARAEPPAALLGNDWITPTDVMFVRNHHPVPFFADADSYSIKIRIPFDALIKEEAAASVTSPCGGCKKNSKQQLGTVEYKDGFKEVSITLKQLKEHFRAASVVSSIQCGGNRRANMDQFGDTGGIPWGVGAIHTGRWKGVYLRDVLAACGLDVGKYLLSGEELPYQHCQFTSVDGLEASIPLDKALAPKGDVLLAYGLNDGTIPEMLGRPLRAVVPGHVGVRNVKWLNSITVSTEEAKGNWQRGLAYKGLGPSIKSAKGVDVEKIQSLQEQPVNSAITFPMEGTVLSPGKNKIFGYSYSGGGRGIVRVDVSVDGGRTWSTASLREGSQQPMHRAWAWTLWECDVDVPSDRTELQIICKATDAAYNTQPSDIQSIWNLRGINNNGWHRVKAFVSSEDLK